MTAPRHRPEPTPEVRSPLLTYRQAGKVLCVTDRTIRALVARGDLAAVRFGGNVRIDPVDLAAFIERSKRGSATPPSTERPAQSESMRSP